MANPIAVPGTVVASGSAVSPGGAQGVQGIQGVAPTIGFLTKTAAYTVLSTDSAQYIICSGGSWTLTLPAPTLGFYLEVRNDMGISGTTGTITIQPTGGTIDGLASLALLPQQECKLRCDGTNWRTFGLKREVILGTQDISSSTASAFVLLPVGYRSFELDFESFSPVTADGQLLAQISFDGGSTWLTGTNYYFGILYNSSATAVANFQSVNATSFTLGGAVNGGAGRARVKITPGTAARNPSISSDSGFWTNTTPLETNYKMSGFYSAAGIANALKYYVTSGNIAQSSLTVKGVV